MKVIVQLFLGALLTAVGTDIEFRTDVLAAEWLLECPTGWADLAFPGAVRGFQLTGLLLMATGLAICVIALFHWWAGRARLRGVRPVV
jgi:hypothetical protein